MLSWKLMKATECACRNVCEGEEAAAHYDEILNRCDRLWLWIEGFVSGWFEEEKCMTISELFRQRCPRWRK